MNKAFMNLDIMLSGHYEQGIHESRHNVIHYEQGIHESRHNLIWAL